MRKQTKQTGLSLIELLVAMLISSVILIAIMNLYLGFGSSSREKKALSTAQDKANFALNELAYQVRMSGAGLCAKPEGSKLQMNPSFDAVSNNTYSDVALTQDATNLLDIRLHSSLNPTPDDVNGSLPMAEDSDALVLSYSSPLALRIVNIADEKWKNKEDRLLEDEMMLSRYDPLVLSSPLKTIVQKNIDDTTGTASNIWLMVSDCNYSEVVYYPSISTDELNNKTLPVPVYINGVRPEGFKRKYYHSGQVGMVAPLVSKVFYVANGENGWSLYEKDLFATSGSSQAEAVMDGVVKMKIEYLSGSGWVSSGARTDWSKELPIKITLTMDEGGDDGERRQFTRVINPRN